MAAIYATSDDMLARFEETELRQLTDWDGTGEIILSKVNQAIQSASALVEGYVATMYRLDPAVPVPLLLVDLTCDIARRKLYRATAPEDVVTNYTHAITQLKDIRKGTLKLDEGAEVLTPRAGKVLRTGGPRRMGSHNMRGL